MPPGGTIAEFQGVPCASVDVARARGFEGSRVTFEIDLAHFSPSFRFLITPLADPAPADPAGAISRVLSPVPPEAPLKQSIDSVGILLVGEVDHEGRLWPDPLLEILLHVESLSAVKSDSTGEVVRVRVTCADERLFYDRGLLERWSFNRRRGGGEVATDAVDSDGRPFTWETVAKIIARNLPGAPGVSAFPAKLAQVVASLEVEPMAAARTGLEALCRELRLLEPCLRWDGTIALHKAGDGRFGYAVGGKGDNSTPLPADHILWRGGSGRGTEMEATYVPDVVYVVGGAKIATVKLPGWEPVLDILGKIAPMDEARIKALTNNRRGLAWLSGWILSADTHKAIPGVSRDVAALLAEQAWLLWRAPLAEIDGNPGPNAHLAPMLPRAEYEAGARDEIIAETASFAPIVKQYLSDARSAARLAAEEELSRIRGLVARAVGAPAIGGGLRAPGGGAPSPATSRDPLSGVADETFFFDPSGDAGNRLSDSMAEGLASGRSASGELAVDSLVGPQTGITMDDFRQAMADARAISEIGKQAAPSLAEDYERSLRQRNENIPGSNANVLLDAAQEVLRLEQELLDQRTTLETAAIAVFGAVTADRDAEEFRALYDAARERIRRLAEQIAAASRQREATTALGQTEDEPITQLIHENLPLSIDTGASIYNEDKLVIRLSRLPGFISKRTDPITSPLDAFAEVNTKGPQQVPVTDVAEARFFPMPVTVTFGARVRPRRDRPWDPSGRVLTSEATGVAFLADTDEESFYRAVFVRGQGGNAIQSEASPELRARALPIRRPELVELVPRDGTGNRLALDRKAADLAGEVFAQPDKLIGEHFIFGRIWPVQCDGIVSAVRFVMRDRQAGFETHIHVGLSHPAEAVNPLRTRVRRPPGQEIHSATVDAVIREGLAP